MIIEAVAPNRIDLAGGTLDIYPLFLFEDDPVTVNLGITLRSHVRISTRDDSRVVIRSRDTGLVQEADSLEQLELGGPLDLIARLIRFYGTPCGIDLETHNDAPRGSGVGGSSALLIAVSGALNSLNDDRHTAEEIIRYSADLEAQNIRIPTGKQDYYPAYHGGVLAIRWGIRQHQVEQLVLEEEVLQELDSRLILCFTREHSSSVTNWSMLRSYIQNEGTARAAMKEIKSTAHEMARVLKAGDLDGFGRALAHEWSNRRQLAPDVSDEAVDRVMDAALSGGAVACKLCGAGGGGCMVVFCRGGAQDRVEESLRAAFAGEAERDAAWRSARILPFNIARQGLTVSRCE